MYSQQLSMKKPQSYGVDPERVYFTIMTNWLYSIKLYQISKYMGMKYGLSWNYLIMWAERDEWYRSHENGGGNIIVCL